MDIHVSVPSLVPLTTYLNPLAHLGCVHIPLGQFDLVYPLFQKPHEWPSRHHIHLCAVGSEQERKHVAVRDYLHGDPLVAVEYVKLKHRLAAMHDGTTLASRERYSLSKTDFIKTVPDDAFAEDNPPD